LYKKLTFPPEFVKILVDIGFLSDGEQSFLKTPIPWKEATQKILGATSSIEKDLQWAVQSKAKFTSTEEKERLMSGLKWVGIFSDDPIVPADNPLDTLCATLEKKMQFEAGERDLVFLQHKFEIEHKDGKKETRTSTLIEYGDPAGYSAMAKLVSESCVMKVFLSQPNTNAVKVGLPCAVAVKLVLSGQISEKGTTYWVPTYIQPTKTVYITASHYYPTYVPPNPTTTAKGKPPTPFLTFSSLKNQILNQPSQSEEPSTPGPPNGPSHTTSG